MKRFVAIAAVGFIAVVAGTSRVSSEQAAHCAAPTFTKDIAPIVYNHCAQ
jgi:hypothetical protein